MPSDVINRTIIEDNTCFGCGWSNPHGLHIELQKDPENPDRLVGILKPTEHMTGFYGITHGGIIYTAMDCMAAWVPRALRPDTKAIWILRSATMTYHRPAKAGELLHLMGCIEKEGDQWDAVQVLTEARNEQGELLNEGHFKVIPLHAEKFKKVVGVKDPPPNWAAFLGE